MRTLKVISHLRFLPLGDNYWYCALILKVSESGVKVLYAEYGNIETLTVSPVQSITTSFLELPFQIIRCSFEGMVIIVVFQMRIFLSFSHIDDMLELMLLESSRRVNATGNRL